MNSPLDDPLWPRWALYGMLASFGLATLICVCGFLLSKMGA